MSCSILHVNVDCHDPFALATFWSAVLARPVAEGDEPGDDEVLIEMGEQTNLLFQRVPEPKSVKNRLHFCLEPRGTRDAEVERLRALGATVVADRRLPDGTGWWVLADLEGNEFCVLRSAGDRQAD